MAQYRATTRLRLLCMSSTLAVARPILQSLVSCNYSCYEAHVLPATGRRIRQRQRLVRWWCTRRRRRWCPRRRVRRRSTCRVRSWLSGCPALGRGPCGTRPGRCTALSPATSGAQPSSIPLSLALSLFIHFIACFLLSCYGNANNRGP